VTWDRGSAKTDGSDRNPVVTWDGRSAKTDGSDRDRVVTWDRDRQARSDGLEGGFGRQTRIRQIAVAVAIDPGDVAFRSVVRGLFFSGYVFHREDSGFVWVVVSVRSDT